MSNPNGMVAHIETTFTIDCWRCANVGHADASTIDAAEAEFRDRGWTYTHAYLMCPQCSGRA